MLNRCRQVSSLCRLMSPLTRQALWLSLVCLIWFCKSHPCIAFANEKMQGVFRVGERCGQGNGGICFHLDILSSEDDEQEDFSVAMFISATSLFWKLNTRESLSSPYLSPSKLPNPIFLNIVPEGKKLDDIATIAFASTIFVAFMPKVRCMATSVRTISSLSLTRQVPLLKTGFFVCRLGNGSHSPLPT